MRDEAFIRRVTHLTARVFNWESEFPSAANGDELRSYVLRIPVTAGDVSLSPTSEF